MKKQTVAIIENALQSDQGVSHTLQDNVMTIITSGLEHVSEAKAAELLGISRQTLLRWRKDGKKWSKDGNDEEFPFSIYNTPTGGYRYYRTEIMDYIVKKTEGKNKCQKI